MAGSVLDALANFGNPSTSGDSGEFFDWDTGWTKDNEESPDCDRDGITDEGIFTVANIKTAIATAQAASSLYNALRMAKLRKKIGDAYAKIAQEQRDYYNDKYKPIELKNIKEASEWEKPEIDPEKALLNRGQMIISARVPFIGKIEDTMRCTGRYCTGQRAVMMNDLLTEQMVTESLVSGMAHRYNVAEKQVREDQRWEYRRNVLNVGRDIPGEASAYADLASGVFGSLGQQAATSAMGAAAWLKYQNKRRDTLYNEYERPPLDPRAYGYKPPQVNVPRGTAKARFEPAPVELELPKVETPKVEVQVETVYKE